MPKKNEKEPDTERKFVDSDNPSVARKKESAERSSLEKEAKGIETEEEEKGEARRENP